jgi:hypothetical protein
MIQTKVLGAPNGVIARLRRGRTSPVARLSRRGKGSKLTSCYQAWTSGQPLDTQYSDALVQPGQLAPELNSVRPILDPGIEAGDPFPGDPHHHIFPRLWPRAAA